MNKTAQALVDAKFHFERAVAYRAQSNDTELTVDAIAMRISAGVEALNRLDVEYKDELFGENWQAMWGMRNRIAHGYILVDSAIINSTVDVDIPKILTVFTKTIDTVS